MKLYDNIKSKRLEKGWSQSELAKRMGYSDKSMIAKIEAGKVDIPQSKVKAFADVFKCTPAELMGWVMDENMVRIQDGSNIEMDLVYDGRDAANIKALQFYAAYLGASEKTRKAIDLLLEESYED